MVRRLEGLCREVRPQYFAHASDAGMAPSELGLLVPSSTAVPHFSVDSRLAVIGHSAAGSRCERASLVSYPAAAVGAEGEWACTAVAVGFSTSGRALSPSPQHLCPSMFPRYIPVRTGTGTGTGTGNLFLWSGQGAPDSEIR